MALYSVVLCRRQLLLTDLDRWISGKWMLQRNVDAQIVAWFVDEAEAHKACALLNRSVISALP